MKDEFQSCPHCETLNFRGSKHCSYCKFLLPGYSGGSRSFRFWNYVIVCSIILSLGVLLLVAAVNRSPGIRENAAAEPQLHTGLKVNH